MPMGYTHHHSIWETNLTHNVAKRNATWHPKLTHEISTGHFLKLPSCCLLIMKSKKKSPDFNLCSPKPTPASLKITFSIFFRVFLKLAKGSLLSAIRSTLLPCKWLSWKKILGDQLTNSTPQFLPLLHSCTYCCWSSWLSQAVASHFCFEKIVYCSVR